MVKRFFTALAGWSLLAAVFVTLVPVDPADAGMIRRERANSNSDWQHQPSTNEYRIGRQFIQFRLADVSANATDYAPVIEAGVITQAYCTLDNGITSANAEVSVHNFTSGGHAGQFTITQSGSQVGSTFSKTGMSVDVTAGSVIALGSDGGSSTTAITYCTVIVDPAAD